MHDFLVTARHLDSTGVLSRKMSRLIKVFDVWNGEAAGKTTVTEPQDVSRALYSCITHSAAEIYILYTE